MNNIVVLSHQNLLDIAVQNFGNAKAAFDLALKNGLSLSEDLIPGQVLQLPESLYKDTDVAGYYRDKKLQPATALSQAFYAATKKKEGISYWAIHIDFKIS